MGCGCNKNRSKTNLKSSRMPVSAKNPMRVPIRDSRLEKLTKNDGSLASKRVAKLKLENAIKKEKILKNRKKSTLSAGNNASMQKFWKKVGKHENIRRSS